ncbi:hypothetical protein MRX96_022904 [Rhipicephalus microplus]
MAGFPTGKTQPHWKQQQLRPECTGEDAAQLLGKTGKNGNKKGKANELHKEVDKVQRLRLHVLSGRQTLLSLSLSQRKQQQNLPPACFISSLCSPIAALHPLSSVDASEPPPPLEGVAAEADDGHSRGPEPRPLPSSTSLPRSPPGSLSEPRAQNFLVTVRSPRGRGNPIRRAPKEGNTASKLPGAHFTSSLSDLGRKTRALDRTVCGRCSPSACPSFDAWLVFAGRDFVSQIPPHHLPENEGPTVIRAVSTIKDHRDAT